jgi:hypothetical protein
MVRRLIILLSLPSSTPRRAFCSGRTYSLANTRSQAWFPIFNKLGLTAVRERTVRLRGCAQKALAYSKNTLVPHLFIVNPWYCPSHEHSCVAAAARWRTLYGRLPPRKRFSSHYQGMPARPVRGPHLDQDDAASARRLSRGWCFPVIGRMWRKLVASAPAFPAPFSATRPSCLNACEPAEIRHSDYSRRPRKRPRNPVRCGAAPGSCAFCR